jgi:hypothetical protein
MENPTGHEVISPYLVKMVRRTPPAGAPVVPDSTPVVVFGNFWSAEVATLGINPSANEFNGPDGEPLEKRRLATLHSLGLRTMLDTKDTHISQVLSDCREYFSKDGNPYWTWFGPLDKLLSQATGMSYRDGTACHLDLVQWATDPVWDKINDPSVRQALLDDGVPHLTNQLRQGNIRLVLLNGRQAVDQVRAVDLAALENVGDMPYLESGTKTTNLYAGVGDGVLFLGWSVNIQSTPGANSAWFRERLSAWITMRSTRLETVVPTSEVIAEDAAPALGGSIRSKMDLINHLQHWLQTSSNATVGDIGLYGGKPWITAKISGFDILVNADTKRAAVEELVAHAAAHGAEAPWHVIANQKGAINKVVFQTNARPTPGWFCYTKTALQHPTTI